MIKQIKQDKDIFNKIMAEIDSEDIDAMLEETDIDYSELNNKINEYFERHYDQNELQNEIANGQSRAIDKIIEQKKKWKYSKLIKSFVSVAAVLFITVLGNQIVAGATNYNLFDQIVQFGQNVIKINIGNNNNDNYPEKNDKLYDLLKSKCSSIGYSPLLPKLVPQDMKPMNIQSDNERYISINLSGKCSLKLEIRKYDQTHPKQNIQLPDGENLKIEKKGNLKFYVSESNSWYNVVFTDSNYTYLLDSNMSYENLKKVLFSFS